MDSQLDAGTQWTAFNIPKVSCQTIVFLLQLMLGNRNPVDRKICQTLILMLDDVCKVSFMMSANSLDFSAAIKRHIQQGLAASAPFEYGHKCQSLKMKVFGEHLCAVRQEKGHYRKAK